MDEGVKTQSVWSHKYREQSGRGREGERKSGREIIITEELKRLSFCPFG